MNNWDQVQPKQPMHVVGAKHLREMIETAARNNGVKLTAVRVTRTHVTWLAERDG